MITLLIKVITSLVKYEKVFQLKLPRDEEERELCKGNKNMRPLQ